MKRAAALFEILCLAVTASAGFKVKHIKPKKAENFQTHATIGSVTYAADLVLEGKDQREYFYKELAPSNIIAVRLAIFNGGPDDIYLPLEGLQLVGPDGNVLPLIGPEVAAKAVLQGMAANARPKARQPVNVAGGVPDPRRDPSDPNYDPRLDPSSPKYEPQDPRNRGQYPPGSNPTGTYPPGASTPGSLPGTNRSGGVLGMPGITLNPGGDGGDSDLTEFERQLAEKDFSDKAHRSEPILGSMNRDRFLYFSISKPVNTPKGYTLHLPAGKGIPQPVILKF